MHYVIIGAGPAGVIAAETLRKTDPQGQITLIGEEPEPPYSRMALPYLLSENIPEAGTYLRKTPDHYRRLGIQVLQDRATALDTAAKRLTLASGQALPFDRLLIATGSRPLTPPIPGIDLPGVHSCWTLADARQILHRAKPKANVVLIGAGFIGCIVLEALAARQVNLTVVEMGDRMVPRMMNQTAGTLIKQWCEAKGVAVHTSTRVSAIQPAASTGGLHKVLGFLGLEKQAPAAGLQVTLDNGHTLAADLVIVAAGVTSNVEFLDGSGVETDQGVLVNARLQTSLPDIYAAGDVAQGRDFSTGGFEVHAIQPTASEHGRIAALNMAGRVTDYQGSLNMNVLATLGLIASSFGQWMGVKDGTQAEACDPQRFRYLSLAFQDDVLVGATSLGLTEHVGILRGLIQGKVHLGTWKDKLLQDPTRVMEAYLARNYWAQPKA